MLQSLVKVSAFLPSSLTRRKLKLNFVKNNAYFFEADYLKICWDCSRKTWNCVGLPKKRKINDSRVERETVGELGKKASLMALGRKIVSLRYE